MMIRSTILASLLLLASPLYGAGLDELSDANPENKKAEEGAASTAVPPNPEAPATTPPTAPAPAAEKPADAKAETEAKQESKRPLSDKLYIATGFGWASASLAEGEWTASGMGDVAVGYHLTDMGFGLFGTYRYAPIAIAGKAKNQAYRGVVEVHNFGVLAQFKLKGGIKAVATGELGIASVALDAADGLPVDDSLEGVGAVISVGGGADWQITEKFLLGPRLHVGGGTATVVQLGANASMYF